MNFFQPKKLPLFSPVFNHTHFKVSDAFECIAAGILGPGGGGCVEWWKMEQFKKDSTVDWKPKDTEVCL